jgi:Fe-S cluster assembly iron-binding protein IscA
VLALTEEATMTIEEILAEPGIPEGSGVRIATAIPATDPAGNSAAATGLQVGLAATPDANDEVIEERGARVFVEDTAAMLLDDKVLDAERSGEQVRFSIANQGSAN